MPEHFHLLLTEPKMGDPSVVMKVIKQRYTRRRFTPKILTSLQRNRWRSGSGRQNEY